MCTHRLCSKGKEKKGKRDLSSKVLGMIRVAVYYRPFVADTSATNTVRHCVMSLSGRRCGTTWMSGTFDVCELQVRGQDRAPFSGMEYPFSGMEYPLQLCYPIVAPLDAQNHDIYTHLMTSKCFLVNFTGCKLKGVSLLLHQSISTMQSVS